MVMLDLSFHVLFHVRDDILIQSLLLLSYYHHHHHHHHHHYYDDDYYYIARRIFLTLSKSAQSAAGLKAMCKSLSYYLHLR